LELNLLLHLELEFRIFFSGHLIEDQIALIGESFRR
jgi:hypothetical protein